MVPYRTIIYSMTVTCGTGFLPPLEFSNLTIVYPVHGTGDPLKGDKGASPWQGKELKNSE